MLAATHTHYFAERYRRLAAQPVPEWMSERRSHAFATFRNLGLPSTQQEHWKYTSLDALFGFPFNAASRPALERHEIADFCLAEADAELVFVNANFAPELSRTAMPYGSLAFSLSNTLTQEPDFVAKRFGKLASEGPNVLGLLNLALATEGAVVRLAPATTAVVHLLFVTATDMPADLHLRNLIFVGESAALTLVETYATVRPGVAWTNAVTEIATSPGASVQHICVQQEALSTFHTGILQAEAASHTRVESLAVSLGARLARQDIEIHFSGHGVDTKLDGLYLAGTGQHVDFHTLVDHAQPRGSSQERYKGVLAGTGHGVFNGRIIVRPGAVKSNASQSNQNLLLSREAAIDTQPQLEIFNDDVKCSHGAAVGQLDEEALFYLRSRGLSPSQARFLLTQAFAQEIVATCKLASLRKRLDSAVASWLDARMEGV